MGINNYDDGEDRIVTVMMRIMNFYKDNLRFKI